MTIQIYPTEDILCLSVCLSCDRKAENCQILHCEGRVATDQSSSNHIQLRVVQLGGKKALLLKPFSTLTVVKIIESSRLDWSFNPVTQIWSDSDMPPPSLGSLAFPAPRAGQILQSITVAPNFSPSVSLPIRTVICPDEIAASVPRKSNSVLGF